MQEVNKAWIKAWNLSTNAFIKFQQYFSLTADAFYQMCMHTHVFLFCDSISFLLVLGNIH